MRNNLTHLQQDGFIQQLITDILKYSKVPLDYPAYKHETVIIQKIKSYIRDHYQEPIRLQQLADLTNMECFLSQPRFCNQRRFSTPYVSTSDPYISCQASPCRRSYPFRSSLTNRLYKSEPLWSLFQTPCGSNTRSICQSLLKPLTDDKNLIDPKIGLL